MSSPHSRSGRSKSPQDDSVTASPALTSSRTRKEVTPDDSGPKTPSSKAEADGAAAPSDGTVDRSTPQLEPRTSDKGDNDEWQAVFSAEANAWYFWNASTNETTWSNPRQSTSSLGSDANGGSARMPAATGTAATQGHEGEGIIPPIDPDLAWLDPNLARAGAGRPITQSARFNARTGRFQADPSLKPDRISEFQRGQRQQEAYYDVRGWENALGGQGIGRADGTSTEQERKRPSAKELERFRQAKEDKKRRKVSSWLA
ncbi:hypothetical protein JCM10908_004981 [Rhodotorula pacifica]|uniref:WW domain-containing protein n=1 Tax=Rhodotorula pacifica TaxID=1495444 RepID=UPI0031703796